MSVFERYGVSSPSTPPSMAVSLDLLGSFDEHCVARLRDLQLPDVSVVRVLAHLLSLGLELSPRVAGAIARRVTELLLNHASNRNEKPVKPGGPENYEFEERAAILEFEAGLTREEAERQAREQCG